MAITQRSEIITAIENWLATTTYSGRSAEFLAACEQKVNRQLRIRPMESHVDLVLRAAIAITAANLGGTANAITATSGSSLTALLLGHRFTFTAEATNTAATTFNVDSIADTTVSKYIGGAISALEANDIVLGLDYEVVYDGTRFLLCPRGGYPLPSRYAALRRCYIDGNPAKELEFFSPPDFWLRWMSSNTGKPTGYTIEGDYIVFGPAPDTLYAAKLHYWRTFAALSADGDTNWLVSNAGMIYVYGSLVEAAPYIGADERAVSWAAHYESLIDDVVRADRKDRFPVGMAMRSAVSKY